jgi:predicted ATPase
MSRRPAFIDMLEPLSRLIVSASKRGEVFVVTHSDGLGQFLEGATLHTLQKHEGATSIT